MEDMTAGKHLVDIAVFRLKNPGRHGPTGVMREITVLEENAIIRDASDAGMEGIAEELTDFYSELPQTVQKYFGYSNLTDYLKNKQSELRSDVAQEEA